METPPYTVKVVRKKNSFLWILERRPPALSTELGLEELLRFQGFCPARYLLVIW
jgi:hypothetical protein